MAAARLRWTLALELLGVFIAAIAAGAAIPCAVALAILFVFVLDILLILATFAIARPSRTGIAGSKKTSFLATCGAIAAEGLAYFALFAVIQPFETLFGAPAQKPRPGQIPVMLVHGYFCNRGLWRWLLARLRARGIEAKPVNLEPPLASIDRLAGQLHGHIEAYLKETGAAKLVLVTHSMGGLAARAYLKLHGGERVEKLITLACPHHGTRLAYLGFGSNARQMQPGSAWLCELAKQEPLGVPAVAVWSTLDNFVAPQASSRLEGAREIVLGGLGHLSFAFSRRVLALLIEELGRNTDGESRSGF